MTITYQRVPSVDRVLREPGLAPALADYGHALVLDAVRAVLAELRRGVAEAPTLAAVVGQVVERLRREWQPFPTRVINATGVVLHTNLGRAPLSGEAMAAIQEAARGYANLEYDLERGARGARQQGLQRAICQLTGAEAALVVNNNASAVLLCLTALAQGRSVVVSRSQLVEIGGGFRVPDIMAQSGARLREVGTTNRTYLRDYERAVDADTVALLRVHPSNFRVVGFVEEVALEELAGLARRAGLRLLDDLGSGALLDTAAYGLAHEPMPQESVAAGADVVCFSGDKLLGGPQAGVIAGTAACLEVIGRHPLARAVRLDKLSQAGLQATLRHYQRGEAPRAVPVWQMIATTPESLRSRAESWLAALAGERSSGRADGGDEEGCCTTFAHALRPLVRPVQSAVGGGSLPGSTLPSYALALRPEHGLDDLAARLRRARPPVVGRIAEGQLLLDPRTVLPGEDKDLLAALRAALAAFPAGHCG